MYPTVRLSITIKSDTISRLRSAMAARGGADNIKLGPKVKANSPKLQAYAAVSEPPKIKHNIIDNHFNSHPEGRWYGPNFSIQAPGDKGPKPLTAAEVVNLFNIGNRTAVSKFYNHIRDIADRINMPLVHALGYFDPHHVKKLIATVHQTVGIKLGMEPWHCYRILLYLGQHPLTWAGGPQLTTEQKSEIRTRMRIAGEQMGTPLAKLSPKDGRQWDALMKKAEEVGQEYGLPKMTMRRVVLQIGQTDKRAMMTEKGVGQSPTGYFGGITESLSDGWRKRMCFV
ncbi:Protein of unknown function [Pyronema omphalodes CBS 100304]|uniref:Uncharacterized protein n=1 Tax=Pyronema omphalodes (strain CBS 100304) TaxID=1076935 RepID=U4LG87_PYROM|nr:Protein of unknown function [Pyronema omphalodes CBS 100304]